ncbi:CRTAC1 family protein [Rhizobium sp. SL86]|uniref:CRTAC1 family protein n=1 Tax=Rhizobium sp. SL86 TaxID=2995148 RepID=UPI00227506BB|nr:CRTAC1 family protein [Rhizobium sp. SL86]MCY1666214.1 CRTAC1 family protein [Rhizobium sp. SL86]
MKFSSILVTFYALNLSAMTAAAEGKAPFLMDVPHFQEEATSAGIDHRYMGPWEYFVGGGVASFDCNSDRKPDLFLAGGSSAAAFYVNHSPTGGALRFEKTDAGIDPKDLEKVLGAYPLDIDNDRILDLVVLRLGENLVLRGKGGCRFEKANRSLAFEGGREWTTAFAATWEPEQLFPTLAFGNYVDRSAPGTPFGTCAPNVLMRPRPGETADYGEPLSLEPGYCALSMLFTDWNNTGERDLRITNDRQYYRGGQEQLWAVPAARAPKLYSAGQGWKPLTIWGMGIAEADLNGDGRPDYALTSMGDTKLQTLDDDAEEDRPTYRDIAFERQATAHRPYTGSDVKPSTGWHAQFADVNNDTNIDLFIAKGNVEAMPEFASEDPNNLLLGDFDGIFHEEGLAAGLADRARSRGAAVDDFNNDGMLDIVIVNRMAPASLLRNLGARTDWGHRPLGNWTKIALDNGKVNPFAVGAKINVRIGTRTITRTVSVGGGHVSGQAGFVHLGLGVNERAVVRVQWPDGEWSQPYRIFANNHVVIERGATAAKYWLPLDGDAALASRQ